MTQENDTSAPSGATAPEKIAAKPKKTPARKAPAKKSDTAKPAAKPAAAAKKAAPAKKTASPEETPPGKENKKAEAAGKSAASKAALKKTAAGKAEAKTPEADKAEAEKSVVNAGPETTKNAEPKIGLTENVPAKPKSSRGVRAAAKKNAGGELKTDPAAKTDVEEPAVRDQTAKAITPATEKTAATATPEIAATVTAGAEEAVAETPEARSSSRRSRRGGRRRNKKTARPAVEDPNAGNGENAPEETDAGTTSGEPRKDAKPGGKPAQKAASPKEGLSKESAPEESAAARGKNAKGVSAKTEPEPAKPSSGKRKMFISVLSGELVEVVLAEEGLVREYYVEMHHQAKVKGNIYKGVVSNIDANLQAAFISYAGGVKNGFLQIDEVHPEYYNVHHDPAKGHKYPPIQKVLKPGQEILVQVVKEPAGTKGAFLTSYLSLPGRFLVLTPGREQIGVSRKVESDTERARLRGILDGLSLGAGLGVIVRTVSTGASKTNLTRDLQFLKRLWKEVRAKGQTQPAPSLVYEELDLSTRAVRDYLTDDVQEVWVDDEQTAGQVTELASLLFPKKQNLVQVHRETGHSLFVRFSLQKQLDQIHSREASLPSGGRLVIDNTEALTAIDINSGRSGGKTNFEDMAFRTNLEAAKAIPSQLRLRDIGGQVVVDFIEMRDRDHWREVEKAVRNGMKGDRARYDVGKIGPFGMLEIVRQRLGSSAISVSTEPCPCCKGTGMRRNMEWQALQSLRDMDRALRAASANNQTSLTYPVETELAFYLLNTKRSILQKMEEESGVALAIRPSGE